MIRFTIDITKKTECAAIQIRLLVDDIQIGDGFMLSKHEMATYLGSNRTLLDHFFDHAKAHMTAFIDSGGFEKMKEQVS